MEKILWPVVLPPLPLLGLKPIFLYTWQGFPWTRPGLGNVVLHEECKTTVVHNVSMMILSSFLMSWRHFWRTDIIFTSFFAKRFHVNV